MANPIVTGYSTNDFFYTHIDDNGECKDYTGENKSNSVCYQNEIQAKSLQQRQIESSTVKNKYNDTMMLYNRELIITVNMILGVIALIYYIYVNKEVLPSIPTSMPDIKMPDIKMPDIKMPEIPKAFPVMNVVSK
jgi:hypothetical protein